jgi:tetratricopeptide (TPR) repeat protein
MLYPDGALIEWFFENNEEMVYRRDDCTLQYSILLTVAGEYEKARKVLQSHRFHTYEGGEGNLTAHHAWLQFLIGKKLYEKGEYAAALAELESGLTFPDNYGEEKTYFVNDAPLYYMSALCAKQLGDTQKTAEYLSLADSTYGAPTMHSYFQCLARQMAGDEIGANALADTLVQMGEQRMQTAAVNDYYGVGSPSYPPFGYDIVKAHTTAGNILCAYGYLAKGDLQAAQSCINQVKKADVADFAAELFEEIIK